MSMLIALVLVAATPALADVAPRCGFGNTNSPSPSHWSEGDCDTGDTASDCDDTGVEAQARRSESGGIPMPVVGSLAASVLIVGLGALRRRQES